MALMLSSGTPIAVRCVMQECRNQCGDISGLPRSRADHSLIILHRARLRMGSWSFLRLCRIRARPGLPREGGQRLQPLGRGIGQEDPSVLASFPLYIEIPASLPQRFAFPA